MYYKNLYVFSEGKPVPVVIRNYTKEDFNGLIEIQKDSFPPPFPSDLWWCEEQLMNHTQLFPEGAFCAEIDEQIIGSITSLIVNFDPNQPEHSWEEITNQGYIRNHDQNGNTLYIVDICVSPPYRKLGIGKWLLFSMYELVVQKGLDRLLGGGRMPNYHKVSHLYTADEYLQQVNEGKRKDPVISFLLRSGRTPIKAIPNYLDDEESCNYAGLMEWRNPFKGEVLSAHLK